MDVNCLLKLRVSTTRYRFHFLENKMFLITLLVYMYVCMYSCINAYTTLNSFTTEAALVDRIFTNESILSYIKNKKIDFQTIRTLTRTNK